MHLSSCTKYVIISITYLTPKPGWASLGSLRASARIREDGGGHCPKTLPPTPFPYDASNQATYNPYINIPVWKSHQKPQTAPPKGSILYVLGFKVPEPTVMDGRSGVRWFKPGALRAVCAIFGRLLDLDDRGCFEGHDGRRVLDDLLLIVQHVRCPNWSHFDAFSAGVHRCGSTGFNEVDIHHLTTDRRTQLRNQLMTLARVIVLNKCESMNTLLGVHDEVNTRMF